MNVSRPSESLACLVVLCLTCAPVCGAEKPLPPQEELDACFGGAFSLEEQVPKTYSAEELEALDRALRALGMTRRDLEFRKDYGEAHLAFPLVLDMMKHPLHIAAYMDGLANGIETWRVEHGLSAELAAAAALHPAIGPLAPPRRAEVPARGKESSRPWSALRFMPEMLAMTTAEQQTQRALEGLGRHELDALRLGLPQLLTWHDVFASPHAEERTKELEELIESQESDAWLDELAARIDLKQMATAWLALPDPERLVSRLGPLGCGHSG